MKTGLYVHTQVHAITEVRLSREGESACWLNVELLCDDQVVADFTIYTPGNYPLHSIPHIEIGPNVPYKERTHELD